MILCEIPLCYAAAKAYFVRRDLHGALVWLGRTVGAGVSALGGVTAALALWFAQEWLCFGSAADAWQNMTRAVTDRVSLTDGAVRDVNVPQVLTQYFRESTEPLLQLGPVSITAWQLLLFALLVGAVSVVACLRRGTAVHRLGAGAGGPGVLDGAVQGARRDPYPPCTDAVALCVCADQLYAAAGAGKTHDPGEEKRPCGIPLNTTKRSAITKCW